MVLAGNASVAEATSVPSGEPLRRTFVVLFTDGLRNSSSASLGAAINAIGVSSASEIEKVFLVFVGNANPSQLSALASQSGREFYLLQNFDDLTSVFLNAIQQ